MHALREDNVPLTLFEDVSWHEGDVVGGIVSAKRVVLDEVPRFLGSVKKMAPALCSVLTHEEFHRIGCSCLCLRCVRTLISLRENLWVELCCEDWQGLVLERRGEDLPPRIDIRRQQPQASLASRTCAPFGAVFAGVFPGESFLEHTPIVEVNCTLLRSVGHAH